MRYLALVLLTVILVWTPLPYGSVPPWAGAALALAISLAAVLAVADGKSARTLSALRTVLAALGGLALLGLAQRLLPALSLAPRLSFEAGIAWGAVALLLAAAAITGGSARVKGWLLAAAVGAASFQMLYGWRQARTAPGEIWGRVVPGPGSRLRGSFVNPDHAAMFFTIMLAVCFGWGWWAWRRSRREPVLGRRVSLLVGPLVMSLVLWAALLATGSRAGLAAAVIGLVVQAALISVPSGRWWLPLALALVLAATGLGLQRLGATRDLGRQLSTPIYEVANNPRYAVWAPALRLWRTAPWLGTGLGTFGEAYPRVEVGASTRVRWGRAHNDPLELLVTGGLLAVGLLLLAVGVLVQRLWRGYRSATGSASRAACLAAFAALPPVLFHELFDFGLTVPANAVLLLVLLGVAAGSPTALEAGAAPLRSPPKRPRPA